MAWTKQHPLSSQSTTLLWRAEGRGVFDWLWNLNINNLLARSMTAPLNVLKPHPLSGTIKGDLINRHHSFIHSLPQCHHLFIRSFIHRLSLCSFLVLSVCLSLLLKMIFTDLIRFTDSACNQFFKSGPCSNQIICLIKENSEGSWEAKRKLN